jgi:acyl-coenzyme A synthetase/AMP-(fatty) acid ligase
VRRAVVAAVGADPDEVALIGRGELPMTSSGKIQRHAVRQRWLVDRFRSASPGSPAP